MGKLCQDRVVAVTLVCNELRQKPLPSNFNEIKQLTSPGWFAQGCCNSSSGNDMITGEASASLQTVRSPRFVMVGELLCVACTAHVHESHLSSTTPSQYSQIYEDRRNSRVSKDISCVSED